MAEKYLSIDDFIRFLDERQYSVTHLTVVIPHDNVVIEIGNGCGLPRIYTFISDYVVDTFKSELNTEEKIVTADVTIVAHQKEGK